MTRDPRNFHEKTIGRGTPKYRDKDAKMRKKQGGRLVAGGKGVERRRTRPLKNFESTEKLVALAVRWSIRPRPGGSRPRSRFIR